MNATAPTTPTLAAARHANHGSLARWPLAAGLALAFASAAPAGPPGGGLKPGGGGLKPGGAGLLQGGAGKFVARAAGGGGGGGGGGPTGQVALGIAQSVGSQIASNIVSRISARRFGGGGGGGGGGDGGGGGYAPGPVTSGYEPAPPAVYAPEPAPEPPAAPLPSTSALQITEIDRGPAADAGLRKGDVIFRVDGWRTRTFDDLRAALTASGGKSRVVFYNPNEGRFEVRAVAVVNARLGVSVRAVPVDGDDPDAGETDVGADEPAGDKALEVIKLVRGGAGRAGIQVGDVIVRVGGRRVSSQADLAAALRSAGDEVEVVVYSPDEGKADVRNVKVQDGKIGVGVREVGVTLDGPKP